MVWYGMVWYGMVYVNLYSAIVTNVSNALGTLVPGNSQVFGPCLKDLKSCCVRRSSVDFCLDLLIVRNVTVNTHYLATAKTCFALALELERSAQ